EKEERTVKVNVCSTKTEKREVEVCETVLVKKNQTYTCKVPVTTPVEKEYTVQVNYCVPKTKTVEYQVTRCKPETRTRTIQCTTYKCVPHRVTVKVPYCVAVKVPCSSCCQ